VSADNFQLFIGVDRCSSAALALSHVQTLTHEARPKQKSSRP